MPHDVHRRLFLKPLTTGSLSGDDLILTDMKTCLRRHLNAALIECAALSRELGAVDADGAMADLRAAFDPHDARAAIQDCFSDGFHTALAVVQDGGGEVFAVRRVDLPSGAAN
jgi:hypothetical protein